MLKKIKIQEKNIVFFLKKQQKNNKKNVHPTPRLASIAVFSSSWSNEPACGGGSG
jgi:hypothetical protein